jgi:hypothetical protein
VARELGLTLLPIDQNGGPLEPNLLYQVPAGTTSSAVAASIAAREELKPIVAGAIPGLFDAELLTWVYAPEGWLRVAFEPKMPEAKIRAVLDRHRLVPAVNPDQPAAQDPYLHPKGAFWNYYISRRIPLVAAGGNAMEVVTRVAHEPGVLWAHPYALTPSFDRGSRLFLTGVGGGWHQHAKLDAALNMLVHLERTTSPEVVRGYAERAKITLVNGRARVLVELTDPAGKTVETVEALKAGGLEVIDTEGRMIFGVAEIPRLFDLAELPGVLQMVTKIVPGK